MTRQQCKLTLSRMNKTLGNEIRRLRLEADFTLREFARKLGISAAHQSDIEHGRRMPSEKVLRDTASALAHVGASYEALKELDARLGSELEEWVRKNPGVRQMLRTAKSSGKPVHELLRDFKEMLEKEDEKDK